MSGYFKKSVKKVLKELNVSDKTGLSEQEVRNRLAEHGKNELAATKRVSPFELLIGQFKDVLIIVLIVAASISLAIALIEDHSLVEPLLIFAIVVAIALIGFFNELKAEKTVESLKELLSDTAHVVRAGEKIEVEVKYLVPGDIVLLEEGSKVSADLRLVEVNRLMINEASLTGESVPAQKVIKALSGEKSLGDQLNMAFSGTFVASGTAKGVVVATGARSEIGKISDLVENVEEKETPLQQKLDQLGRRIGLMVLLLCLVVFVLIYLLNQDDQDETTAQRLLLAFTAAVALAVAAIPEGLAFVVRISLALGARSMAAKNALVRKLSAVEALGSTDIICTDKTGTLTKGEMKTTRLWTFSGDLRVDEGGSAMSNDAQNLLMMATAASDAHRKNGVYVGDPTEIAIVEAFDELDLKTIFIKQLSTIPFSSSRKMMSVVYGNVYGKSDRVVVSKGAVDVLLEKCTHYLAKDGKHKKLTKPMIKKILDQQKSYGSEALRVLGVATSPNLPKKVEDPEKGLSFVGMLGLFDPPRLEVKEVMGDVQDRAGMRVVMITGDHVDTARAIAKQIGIKGRAFTGVQLDAMSESRFGEVVKSAAVFARVNPEHKLRIVQTLQGQGFQVAMTGDGVNDAPAIKAADIGIAMGVTGTDAAKESSDLILLDDRFLTIISAIKSGRGIYDNVRKFVNNLLSTNIAEVISILGGIFLFQSLILAPAQLLFINIVTDGLPAVALGSDPPEKGIMSASPSRFKKAIITKKLWTEMLIYSFIMSAILLGHYRFVLWNGGSSVQAVSVAFASMVIYEMVRLVGIRSNYRISWRSNIWLIVSVITSLASMLAVMLIGPLQSLFGLTAISAVDWLIISAGSAFLFIVALVLNHIFDFRSEV